MAYAKPALQRWVSDTGSGVARNQGHWGLENVEINAPNADLERHIFDEKYRFIQ